MPRLFRCEELLNLFACSILFSISSSIQIISLQFDTKTLLILILSSIHI